MIVDNMMIERADHLAQSGATMIGEQVSLIEEMRAAGRPCGRAEDFLILLQRAHLTLQQDVEFLRSKRSRR